MRELKQMLTETHLTEARIYHAPQNISKSKASLTASRTVAICDIRGATAAGGDR